METPPEERVPVKTYVSEFAGRLVREAVLREGERGGQVYFVHNRVHNIVMVADRVRDIIPEASVGIAHGQMPEHDLETAMLEFVQGQIDVLVCTTIIESGLDIPNVNTIIVNQADKLGLGQLYQLRGRVGRGAPRAYAYLLYDRKGRLTEPAKQRPRAISAGAHDRAGAAGEPREGDSTGQELVDRFGEPPPPVRSLLYVILVRVLAAQAGVQAVATEGGRGGLKLKEGLLVPRETLEPRAPRGVHLGRTLVKVEMGEGWRTRLLEVLESLAGAQPGPGKKQ